MFSLKEYDIKDTKDLYEILKEKGFRILGEGYFSIVWDHEDHDEIVKMSFDPKTFDWYKENNPAKYSPTTYESKLLDNGFYYIGKKYKPLREGEFFFNNPIMESNLFTVLKSYSNLWELDTVDKLYENVVLYFINGNYHRSFHIEDDKFIQKIESKQFNQLIEAIFEARKAQGNLRFDLKFENLMLDEDENIVFNDPFYNSDYGIKNRTRTNKTILGIWPR